MTRVLYVEDETLLALSMEGAILDGGFEVELAHDGKDGFEQAQRFKPEIIVTDYMMPRMDGPTMLRLLRDEGFDGPVVMTTAVPEGDLSADIREQIAIYLPKPFTETDLVDAIRRVLPATRAFSTLMDSKSKL